MKLLPLIIDSVRRLLGTPQVGCMLGLVLAAGCGSSTGTVTGTVTFRGENVPSGTIAFISGGKLVQSEIHAGRYEVTGVPPGEAQVTVVRLNPHQPDPFEALNKARQQMHEDTGAKKACLNLVPDAWQLNALQKKRHLLPYVYSSPGTSDLRFAVVAGRNTFDVVLIEMPKPK